jgi:hypothetical protein
LAGIGGWGEETYQTSFQLVEQDFFFIMDGGIYGKEDRGMQQAVLRKNKSVLHQWIGKMSKL